MIIGYISQDEVDVLDMKVLDNCFILGGDINPSMFLMSGFSHKVVPFLKPLNALSFLLKWNSFIRCSHSRSKFVISASTSSIISLTEAISALALFSPL